MGSTETGDSSETKRSPGSTVSHLVPQNAPCLLDDIFTVLSESLGDDAELTNSSLTLFGICTVSDNSSATVLLELAKKTSRHYKNGLEVLHPTGGNNEFELNCIFFLLYVIFLFLIFIHLTACLAFSISVLS